VPGSNPCDGPVRGSGASSLATTYSASYVWEGGTANPGMLGDKVTAVIFVRGIGGYADRAFEESGKLLVVGLAWITGTEREGGFYPVLRDRFLGIETM
jgi:hypothetical protein